MCKIQSNTLCFYIKNRPKGVNIMNINNFYKLTNRLDIKIILSLLVITSTLISEEISEFCGMNEQFVNHEQDRIANRPEYTNELSDISNDHFLIHYALEGTCNTSLLPDDFRECSTTIELVEAVLEYVEEAYQVYNNNGWLPPPPDADNGGDSRYDIYITYTGKGMCKPQNPYPLPYLEGVSSFIEITKDYNTWEGLSGDTLLQAIVVHELQHAYQFRYNSNYDTNSWLFESTAVYMEDVVNDGLNSLYERLLIGETPLDNSYHPINYLEGNYPYTTFLWLIFLSEFYNDSNGK